MKKICEYCKEEFEAKTTVSKYCNDKCYQKKYNEQNKDKIKETSKIYHLNNKNRRDKNRIKNNFTKDCKFCGKEFKTNISVKIYCSRKCKISKHNNGEYFKKNRDKLLKRQREYSSLTYVKNANKERYWRSVGIKSMSIERYNAMFQEQNGNCGICGRNEKDYKKKLHVDHNHNTGEVRGLLCQTCNTSLGGFKDNPDILASATSYLQQDYTYAK